MQGPLVSVVIPNFNYADFLRVAIRSALAQTYPVLEVIVVDDGSTDRSCEVIADFGTRIRALFKANGGQTSTNNAGFLASRGDIVLFLDADDALRPDAVERVVAAMAPGVAAVQFCLATIDQESRPLGGVYPPLPKKWTPQRIRECVRAAGFYPYPPTSGNAYARWFLDRLLPLPADRFPRGTDGVLNAVAPLHGEVVVLNELLGFYRIHGGNMGALAALAPERFSYFVALDRDRGGFLIDQARALGVALEDGVLDRAFFYLQYRLASRKLRPDLHPIAHDRLHLLVWRLARAALLAPDSRLLRAFVVIWGAVVAVAPQRLAGRLVAARFIGTGRPAFIEALLRRLGLVHRRAAHELPAPVFAGAE